MNLRYLISFSLAMVIGLTSASAYVAEQQRASALQVETAVLLDREGNPRCIIGKRPSEYLTAEKLDQFYRENSQIDSLVLDNLRECDENDEFYAQLMAVELGTEEISLGMAVPPSGLAILRTFVRSAAIGGVSACLLTVLHNRSILSIDHQHSIFRRIGSMIVTGTVLVGMTFIPSGIAWGIMGKSYAGTGTVMSIMGAGPGFLVCDYVPKKD